MNLNITTAGLFGLLRNIASYAGIITAVANVGGMPTSTRAVLLAISGAIQYAEHNSNSTTKITTPKEPTT